MKPHPLPEIFEIFRKSTAPISAKAKRVYTDQLVLWLGVYQELQLTSCRGSLQELSSSRAHELMGDCSRKGGVVSKNVGALIQARQEIKMETLQSALCLLYEDLRQDFRWNGYRVIGLDGSTVTLNYTSPELRKAYPGGRDGRRVSRWPIIQIVMMIDLLEGIVMSANLGAKYGKNATSEQELSRPLFEMLDKDSLILADRNFGTFDIVKQLMDQELNGLVRLTATVAKKLAGGDKLVDGLDKKVLWQCTPEIKKKYGYADDECQLAVRLIVKKIEHAGKSHLIHFVSTLDIGTPSELAELYPKRWRFEEDLKTMKVQMRLKEIQAQTKNSAEVELYCKLLAFNLTRGMVLLAVRNTEIDPRRISFSLAFLIVRTGLQEYQALTSDEARSRFIEDVLERLREAKIPYRPKRSNPRARFARNPGRYKTLSSAWPKKN